VTRSFDQVDVTKPMLRRNNVIKIPMQVIETPMQAGNHR
jgi:hypothetical protein